MSSAKGRELDSLADVIPFGVAPAAGANTRLDQAILLFFTACGLSRLARFNVTADSLSGATGKVKYFEGTPIPTSVHPANPQTIGSAVNLEGLMVGDYKERST